MAKQVSIFNPFTGAYCDVSEERYKQLLGSAINSLKQLSDEDAKKVLQQVQAAVNK